MDALPWAALGIFLAAATTLSGWQWRLSARLTKADTIIEELIISTATAKMKAEAVAQEFANFRVHVASDYASSETIAQLERRLVDAINRLGDRLDKVFVRSPP